jgi:hypothetical protein
MDGRALATTGARSGAMALVVTRPKSDGKSGETASLTVSERLTCAGLHLEPLLRDLAPLPFIEVQQERPPTWGLKGFGGGHGCATVDDVLHVVFAVEALLAVVRDASHGVDVKRLGRAED